MINLAICGVGGRMGGAVLARALVDESVTVTGLVESKAHPLAGKNLNGLRVETDVKEVLSKSEVVIDFTVPEATLRNAEAAASAHKALVVGTTGLEGKERETFLRIVKPIPVVLSPNMSLSANLLFEIAEILARHLPDYDAEISEIHHNLKKDAPSGTARRLADSVIKGRASKTELVYGRHGLVGARKASEVGVHALRGGDVVGDHTVFFFGQGERIELIHRVTSRDAFAHGALAAAKWVVRRPAGLYDMRDVLGLNKKS